MLASAIVIQVLLGELQIPHDLTWKLLLVLPPVACSLAFLFGGRQVYQVIGSGGKDAQRAFLWFVVSLALVIGFLAVDPSLEVKDSHPLYSGIVVTILALGGWLGAQLWILRMRIAALGLLGFLTFQAWLSLANFLIEDYGVGMFSFWRT